MVDPERARGHEVAAERVEGTPVGLKKQFFHTLFLKMTIFRSKAAMNKATAVRNRHERAAKIGHQALSTL